MASMMISGLIPLLQQPGLMLEMEEQRQKLLDFFTDALPKLSDAELRAEAEPDVRTWLDNLNAVAYDADDILDDFRYAKLQADADAKSCQNQNGARVRASLFLFFCFKISTINRSEVLRGIENRIGSVVQKIEHLVERMRVLNFQPSQEINIIASAERSQQLIFSSPTEIVGRDKEKEVVLKDLRNYVQLCIMGPQGIGKTAFIRSVCNDTRIGKHFEYVLWVEDRPEFNIGKMAKSIIDQVIGKDCCISEGNTDLLEFRFYQELSFKRCIIVVDGVLEVHQQLMDELQLWIDEIRGADISLIVIRSSNKHRIEHWNSRYFILGPLMVEDGWNLFCEKAFSGDVTKTCPKIIEEMGKEIMVRCGGSPLALNMMGGLMRFKKGPEEWQGVINQLKKEVLNGIGAATVEAIIKVCYNNLCSQVKQCFAFCSLFPKRHYMDKEVLIKLWMANGLLLPSDGSRSMPLEEKGNIVFNELASRHFFEDVKLVHEDSYGNKHGYHSRVTYKLLDLIHEQAVIAAREFALQIPYLLSTSGDSRVDIPMLLQTNPAVRILLFPDDPFSRNVNCSIVPKKTSLRGLHLHSASFERNLLELKYMKHLRYLDLSCSRIKTLPESTSLLYFLQTLNLSKCLLLYQLPENMKYMRSLRHLYIHKCPKLKKMPAHLSRLSNLQTLTTYIIGEKIAGTGIDEIKGLHLSGLLELYNLHKVKTATMAKEAHLISKKNVDRLTLCWGSEQLVMPKENNDLVVLEALQPHNQLKVLKIEQYGGNEFSTWLADPMTTCLVNLVELHLIGCSQCTTLPAVWKLSSLRVLCLKHMVNLTCISRNDKEDSSKIIFPSLKRLVLVGLKKLERWKEEEEEEEEDEEEDKDKEEEEEEEEEEELWEYEKKEEEEKEEEEEDAKGGATCSNLKPIFEKVLFTMLDELKITNCPNLKTMPHVPQLKHITASIENYKLLQSVTDLITQKESLVEEANIAKANDAHNEAFPALGVEVEGRVNKKLRTMRMDSTNSVFKPTALPHSLLGLWRPFEELQYLEIFNCDTLVFWPLEFRYLKMLTRLSIRNCPNLTGILPVRAKMNMSLFPKLRKLEFYGCNSLKQVPYCEILDVLELDECPEVESVLANTSFVMKILYLSCTSWTSLPSELGNIFVRTLWVSECYSLTSLPDWLTHQPFLQNLIISECPSLKELPGGHEWLSSLEKLQISKCPDLEIFCNKEHYSSQIGTSIDNPLPTYEDDVAAAFAGASTTGTPNTPPTQISALNGDMKGMVDIKPRIVEDASDKSKMWKLTEINEPTQCRSIRLMTFRKTKISILVYTNSGVGLLALASNAIILQWKWPRNNNNPSGKAVLLWNFPRIDNNPSGKATARVTPQLFQPRSGILMTNDVTDCNPEDAVPCFALSDNDSCVVSASGGRISVFDMINFQGNRIFAIKPPPPAATFLTFIPQDDNMIAIGMDDSTIQIYALSEKMFLKRKMRGHSKRITGLAFSNVLDVLVSSGADSQIFVWSFYGWEKQRSKFVPYPQSYSGSNMSDTLVQFHQDQINFLVVHASQIAIYETTELECLRQWVPRENAAPPITHATFSCDGQLVYATFVDATVCIFSASNLKLRCRILPAAYLPPNVRPNVHPLVVAAHPLEPNQFAIGLTDGGVHVIEPLESEGKWGAAPLSENRSSSKTGAPNTPTQISTLNGDTKDIIDINPIIVEDASDKSKIWKLTKINEPTQCQSTRFMDNSITSKLSILVYTNSGVGLLALASKAVLLWNFPRIDNNPSGKATAWVTQQLFKPRSRVLMRNDVTGCNPEDAVPCFALSKNGRYAISASGGPISLLNMIDFKTINTFMSPPPAATFLAFYPQGDRIIAIGMDDSTIQIYHVLQKMKICKLKGHLERITGLAFSSVLNVLVSSGADSQICVWNTELWKLFSIDGWELRRCKILPNMQNHSGSNMSDTRVQFHQDQINFLVVHASQIAIYETTKLECLRQWVPRENAAPPISHATFSCDGELVYATFVDATVCIFSASNLKLICRILPAAYLPPNVSPNVHPLVVAAHPKKPNQFAIGLSDGGIHVIEPLESEGKWGAAPPSENESSSSLPPKAAQTPGASSSGQSERYNKIED